jgi:hypothetical protein
MPRKRTPRAEPNYRLDMHGNPIPLQGATPAPPAPPAPLMPSPGWRILPEYVGLASTGSPEDTPAIAVVEVLYNEVELQALIAEAIASPTGTATSGGILRVQVVHKARVGGGFFRT